MLSVPPSPAFWFAVVCYGVATALLLGALLGHRRHRSLALVVVAAAFIAHGVDVGWRGTQGVHPAQSVREALGFLAFVLTGGYLLVRTRYSLTLGGVVVMPTASVLLVLGRLSPAGDAIKDLSVLGRIHITLATLGVGIFALASTLSAVYLAEDRALKRKRFDALVFIDEGAPLVALDRVTQHLIWVGLPVFTIALVLGAVWTSRLHEELVRAEYVLGLVTWTCFTTVLVARTVFGWRGRRAAQLTLTGFCAALSALLIYLLRRVGG